jgi:hypothetical protein
MEYLVMVVRMTIIEAAAAEADPVLDAVGSRLLVGEQIVLLSLQ